MTWQPIGELISKQAVLEMAYDLSEVDGEHFTEPCMVVDVEDIQKLPSFNPQGQKWIPVSERLPQLDVEVLVTDDAGGLATISTDSMYENEVTGEKEWYTSQNVTAWMPLPEPYDPQESEDKWWQK